MYGIQTLTYVPHKKYKMAKIMLFTWNALCLVKLDFRLLLIAVWIA